MPARGRHLSRFAPPKIGHRRALWHGCPVEFGWTGCTALILHKFKHLPVIWTRGGINAIRHHNSVLDGLLKQIPWSEFDRLVDEHGADARIRTLSTKGQLVGLLYAQLAGAVSLREIETAMQSHSARLYHLGGCELSRSTLADANARRPFAVFQGLFQIMAARASRGLRRATGEAVRLIDSTGLRLSGMATDWARFSAGVNGAKAHILYDPDAERPLYLQVTTAKVNDITIAKAMPIEPGATYVFDLGYYDYGWWAKLNETGSRIVTRLKKNTPLATVKAQALPEGSALLYDRIGHLPDRLAYSRSNPFQDPVREIGVMTDDGKTLLRLVTNDLDAPAQQIADLYKRRHRVVLPMDQADPEDRPLRRTIRERRAHPDRRRPYRLSAPAPRPRGHQDHRKPSRLRPPRPRQHHAPPRSQQTARAAPQSIPRPQATHPQLAPSMNRTVVPQSPAMTDIGDEAKAQIARSLADARKSAQGSTADS